MTQISESVNNIAESVMSEGQLNELVNAALIEKTTITEDMVEAPNVYTRNLVALIAKFGTVRALNIIGDEIEGKTLSAYVTDEEKEEGKEPSWRLNRGGDGYLANGNISWDENGDVTFGENVKIGWGSVTDTPDDFGSITIMFSNILNEPGNPDDNPDNWSEDNTNDTIWMATSTGDGWSVVKIKGADGKDGVNGQDGAPGRDGIDGQDGAQVYLHIKYADEITYGADGVTVTNVIWTADNGEAKGPYQGMYSDYTLADSTNFRDYKWYQIDAIKAVTTELGKYQISSNLIKGKTIQPTTEKTIVSGTPVQYFDADGKETTKQESNGSSTGPTWQLRNQGDGYLASGNIRWDVNGNVEFGDNVKLGWASTNGVYKLTANTSYLRRKDSGRIDYKNEAGDSLLNWLGTTEEGSMFNIYAKKYNSTTCEYDTPVDVPLTFRLTYLESSGKAVKDLYGSTTGGTYSQVKSQVTNWMYVSNIRVFITGEDVNRYYIDIPIIGFNEEWRGNDGLTEGDVDNRISTALSRYKVTSENIEGTTIKGSVIKAKYLSDMEDSGAFYLDGEEGVFGLGNDAIRYDGDDVYISGDNVHINGDVLINGTAIMNGIESDASAKQQLDELIAGKIDAAEIKTSVLETKSSVEDSVRISDNYIHCFNDSGDKNLIISSNKMDTSKLDRILGSGYTSQQGTGMVLSNVTLSKPSGSSVYSNQSVWYSHTSPCSLGYILAGSTVTVYVALQALNVASSNYNYSLSSQYVPAANWTISEGTGNQVPYVVGGGGVTYAGGMLLVYKKNTSGEWEEYDGGWIKGTWQDCAQPWTSSGTATTKYYKCVIDSSSIDIDEDGEYGIRLGMEVGAIQASAATTVKSIAGLLKASVNQKQPSTYTEIGKDGIVVYDGTNVLKLDSNGVVMMAKTSIGSSKFYGLKVTKDGFYLCKNGDSWREWDPSFD